MMHSLSRVHEANFTLSCAPTFRFDFIRIHVNHYDLRAIMKSSYKLIGRRATFIPFLVRGILNLGRVVGMNRGSCGLGVTRCFRTSLCRMYGCIPTQLPVDIRAQIESMIESPGDLNLEAFMRPGCVFLTVDTFRDVSETTSTCGTGLQAALERMLASAPSSFWTTAKFVVRHSRQHGVIRCGAEAPMQCTE